MTTVCPVTGVVAKDTAPSIPKSHNTIGLTSLHRFIAGLLTNGRTLDASRPRPVESASRTAASFPVLLGLIPLDPLDRPGRRISDAGTDHRDRF